MATFSYDAMNSVGQPVKGEVSATNKDEAVSKVRAMGHYPTKIKEKAGKGGSKSSRTKGPGAGAQRKRTSVGAVSGKVLVPFTRNLAILVDAGLPLLRSLRILQQQEKPGPMRVAIRLVAEDVEGGATLSDSMARHPKAFDKLYVNMVRAGEIGGVLDIILNRLSEFMEKAAALKRKVVGALIYPIVVITFSMAIVLAIMLLIIPQFQTIFNNMGERLPALTRMIVDISDWLIDWGWAKVIGTPIAIIIISKIMRKFEGGRYALDKFKISIPLFGQLIAKTAIARFSRTLGTLLAAGVPILDALEITSEATGNEVYGRALKKVQASIREGIGFAEPLRQAKVVDTMVVNMIDVGEETGELDKMLEKVADVYDEEVSTLVDGLVSMIEPLMVIFLGVIIGTIVIALFMPMVSMLDSVA